MKRSRTARATWLRWSAAGWLLLAVFALSACDGPLRLAAGGRPLATIVCPPEASASERHAAEELREFLGRVTGARFRIFPSAEVGGVRILVGPDAVRDAGYRVDSSNLGEDGLVIRSQGRDLLITGGRPRGTLNAAVTFLQEVVGCRFWTPEASTIPHAADLAVGPLDMRYVPPFRYRDDYWYGAFDPDWAARNRLYGMRAPGDAAHGGHLAYAGFVHTFYQLVDPERDFAEHPEWFSLVGGRRTTEPGQLCLTNPSLQRVVARRVVERLRRHPDARIASVSQNDWDGGCECDRCLASDREEGSPSGTLLRFVNAVAREVATERPDVLIDTLAYQYTRRPPRHVRPAPNVVIRLCSIECSFAVPLTSDRNADFRADLLGWERIASHLFVWDYTTNFRHYLLPHPNLHVLGPNLRFFASHGVTGVFEEGAYQCPGTELAPLRAWLLAQLLWNPFLDDDRLIDEFLAGYYGEAAPHVRALIDRVERAARSRGARLGFYDRAEEYRFLSLPVLSGALEEIDGAARAVAGDPQLEQRVEALRLPYLYAFLLRWRSLADEWRPGATWPVPRDPRALLADVESRIEAAGITMLGEGQPLEELRRFARGLPPLGGRATGPG